MGRVWRTQQYRLLSPGWPLISQPGTQSATAVSSGCSPFLQSNHQLVLFGSLSEQDADHVSIKFWPDADLNGDEFHTKSTSGCWIELAGLEGRCWPLAWFAKKQKGSAASTTEAETVSMAVGAREEAIPLQQLIEMILDRLVACEIGEDKTSTIKAAHKGYSPALKHLLRQQRRDIAPSVL